MIIHTMKAPDRTLRQPSNDTMDQRNEVQRTKILGLNAARFFGFAVPEQQRLAE
jgi:hypothetical protein